MRLSFHGYTSRTVRNALGKEESRQSFIRLSGDTSYSTGMNTVSHDVKKTRTFRPDLDIYLH